MNYIVRQSVVADAVSIYEVQKATRLATYINEEYGVTREAILERYVDKEKFVERHK